MAAAELKDEHFGAKTIGTFGGIMLLINNLAGPTIMLMPGLTQESGWLAMILAQVVIAAVSAICGYMLLAAMRAIPKNSNFELRVEYTDLVSYYLPKIWYLPVMICYFAYLCMTLMSYIIQSAQVIDYVLLDVFGCAAGLELWPSFGAVCGNAKDDITPFGHTYVLSAAFVIVAVVCAPFAMRNLDDNILLQVGAIAGLTVLAVIWIGVLVTRPHFPSELPVCTSSLGGLFGTLLFNFAFMSTLPSWANEKQPEVPVGLCFWSTMGFVVVVYSAIGIVGGLAYKPYYETDATLFSKLNGSGSRLAQATVVAYPILQNFTSIPVFSILIRYNLLQSGLFGPCGALVAAVVLPWLASVPFYTGSGFAAISTAGGLVSSSVINFVLPVAVYYLSRARGLHHHDDDDAPQDESVGLTRGLGGDGQAYGAGAVRGGG